MNEFKPSQSFADEELAEADRKNSEIRNRHLEAVKDGDKAREERDQSSEHSREVRGAVIEAMKATTGETQFRLGENSVKAALRIGRQDLAEKLDAAKEDYIAKDQARREPEEREHKTLNEAEIDKTDNLDKLREVARREAEKDGVEIKQ